MAETFDGVEHAVLSVWAPASPDAGDLVGLQTQVPHRIGEAGVDTLLRIVAPQDIAHRLQEAMRKITTRELVKVQAGRRSRYRRPLPVETFEGEPGIAEWRGARDTA